MNTPCRPPALPPTCEADGPAWTRRAALAALAASAGLGGAVVAEAAPLPRLRDLAQQRGLAFGSCLGGALEPTGQRFGWDDPAYRALLARECGVLVAENEMKWRALRPSAEGFDFAAADRLAAWAAAQGLALRGHTLLWMPAQWLPDWLGRHDFGPQPVQAAEQLLATHVRTVCQHFGTGVASWDVVNEAIDERSGALRENAFSPHLPGIAQVELAFRAAAEAAPHAELVYNDYMGPGEGSARHRDGVLRLLTELRGRGVPVHALGVQAHLGTDAQGRWTRAGGAQDRAWRQFLDAVSALGLKLLITELDVNDRFLPAAPGPRDAQVAAIARDFLDTTLSYRNLHTVMLWGMADPYSWLQVFGPRADGRPKRGTPYDARLQPKPLREALVRALRAAPPR